MLCNRFEIKVFSCFPLLTTCLMINLQDPWDCCSRHYANTWKRHSPEFTVTSQDGLFILWCSLFFFFILFMNKSWEKVACSFIQLRIQGQAQTQKKQISHLDAPSSLLKLNWGPTRSSNSGSVRYQSSSSKHLKSNQRLLHQQTLQQ